MAFLRQSDKRRLRIGDTTRDTQQLWTLKVLGNCTQPQNSSTVFFLIVTLTTSVLPFYTFTVTATDNRLHFPLNQRHSSVCLHRWMIVQSKSKS
ncbi:Uncharacterized protein APZ42_017951 [Daphnia magna]|uniref:Uncharacterized protein n=1 Tax=Daphnia magna TaxID=35525 RepID=A0A164ZFE5_9CRUS|nr:Uncharacterized protein APZ42_017951 [Daphnia magna]